MTVYSNDGLYSSDDPKLEIFSDTRDNPKFVRCIKSNPPMHGFGRALMEGDIVLIHGTVHNHLGFCVSVPSECAFYSYDCFEPTDDRGGRK